MQGSSTAMNAGVVSLFGSHALPGSDLPAETRMGAILKGAASGQLRALVVDARSPLNAARSLELLRALYDDPRRPRRLLHPWRVVALIADGDVATAFALGRFGLGEVLEARALAALPALVARCVEAETEPRMLAAPLLAPARTARVGPHIEGELPTVAIGYAHAPETLAVLAQYRSVLHAAAEESTVFADAASLLDVMIDEGFTCQTNLATKAGVSHSGQFIGSFEFYRELRKTRYAKIPEHPEGLVAMEVFIAVDEVIHEVLHLLFLADVLRAKRLAEHTEFAEELSLSWWQGVIHQRVWGDWLADRHILEINDDFLLSEQNAAKRPFWKVSSVFDRYAWYPWVPYVIAQLPERASYIGERPDLHALTAHYGTRPEAAFLAESPSRLQVPGPFSSYPSVPRALRVAREDR